MDIRNKNKKLKSFLNRNTIIDRIVKRCLQTRVSRSLLKFLLTLKSLFQWTSSTRNLHSLSFLSLLDFLQFLWKTELFSSRGKSYNITEARSRGETWYDWIENARYHLRKMVLSKGALSWIDKRLSEASGERTTKHGDAGITQQIFFYP